MSSGPFQTAVNQLLGMTAGAVAGIKKYVKDERQDLQKEKQAEEKIQQRGIQALQSEENRDLAAEQVAAKAYKAAQDRGLASPNRILFDEAGNPLATYDEAATIMADKNLSQHLSVRKRNTDVVIARRDQLKAKKGASK